MEIEEIHAAAERIRGGVMKTPCPMSIPLSEATGCEVYCKMENLQRTGSFKERGALNRLLQLTCDEKKLGVVAASAGNHALGISYHGLRLGIPVTVVMPRFAPLTKVSNCEKFGATVLLEGMDIEEARAKALSLAEKGMVHIHGFDDPQIIAGQGTVALEILEQVPDLEAILVPVGGAGLIAGIAATLAILKPSVQVIGIEPANAASLEAAMKSGEPVVVPLKNTLADGLAVPRVGDLAFKICRNLVSSQGTVTEQMIALAIVRLLELEKLVVEGAGAVGLAALLSGKFGFLKGKKVVLPLCGGNIDTNLIGRVIERGLAADHRLSRIQAVISDRPGGLSQFTAILAEVGANILEISHDRAFAAGDINQVSVHCLVETRNVLHVQSIRKRLQQGGFRVIFPDLDFD